MSQALGQLWGLGWSKSDEIALLPFNFAQAAIGVGVLTVLFGWIEAWNEAWNVLHGSRCISNVLAHKTLASSSRGRQLKAIIATGNVLDSKLRFHYSPILAGLTVQIMSCTR